MPTAMTNEAPTNITGVMVERLFGLYDYALGKYGDGQPFESNLIVLYGDNGCGKTTLLRLVYHLLSKEQKRGHRTALGSIPLRRFVVRLEDGSEVGMARDGESIRGSYRFFIARPGSDERSCLAVMNQEGAVSPPGEPESEAHWAATMEALASLNVALYYLPDNRRPESQSVQYSSIDIDAEELDFVMTQQAGRLVTQRRVRPERHVLDATISDLENLIRDEALRASGIGEANINSIYAEIAKR